MKLLFGKYKGYNVEDIVKIDRGYLEWCISEKGIKNTRQIKEIKKILEKEEKIKNIKITFGKYKGEYIDELIYKDRQYLEWCVSEKGIKNEYIIKKIKEKLEEERIIKEEIKKEGSLIEKKEYNIKKDYIYNATDNEIKEIFKNLNMEMNEDELIKIYEEYEVETKKGINEKILESVDKTIEEGKVIFPKRISINDILKIIFGWGYGILYKNIYNINFEEKQKQIIELIEKEKKIKDILIDLFNKENEMGMKVYKKIPFILSKGNVQFKLLDLTYEDMYNIYKDYNEDMYKKEDNIENSKKWKKIYYKLIKNPYRFKRLNLEKCDRIINKIGKNIKNYKYEKYLGEISRLVYFKIKNTGWTYLPYKLFKKEYKNIYNIEEPNIVESIDNLDKYYGIKIKCKKEEGYVGLKEDYNKEKYIKKYIKNNIKCKNKIRISKISTLELNELEKDILESYLKYKYTILDGDYELIENINKKLKKILSEEKVNYIYLKSKLDLIDLNVNKIKFLFIDNCENLKLSFFIRIFEMINEKPVNIIFAGNSKLNCNIKGFRFYDAINESNICNVFDISNEKESLDIKSFINIKNLNNVNDLNINFNIETDVFVNPMDVECYSINKALQKINNNSKISRNYKLNNSSSPTSICIGDPIMFTKSKIYNGMENTKHFVKKYTSGIINNFFSCNNIEYIAIKIKNNKNEIILVDVPIINSPNLILSYCIPINFLSYNKWNNIYIYITNNSKKYNYSLILTCLKYALNEKITIFNKSIVKIETILKNTIYKHYSNLSKNLSSLNIDIDENSEDSKDNINLLTKIIKPYDSKTIVLS